MLSLSVIFEYLCTQIKGKRTMSNNSLLCIIASLLLVLTSCSKHDFLNEMERIKEIGDENPERAIAMLDSLEMDIRESSEYVRAKYDLLKIRLNDKAKNQPGSDIVIRKLVEYFEKEGSLAEKQEVCYYAGSVYRDLQDTPRSLDFFLKSLEYSNEGDGCDSIMLRSAYSNLNYLYYGVQNFEDAARAAESELSLCKQLKLDCIVAHMHLGASYLALDKPQQADSCLDSAYREIKESNSFSQNQASLVYLLNHFSELGETGKAEECFSHIELNPLEHFIAFVCVAFAQYYESVGKTDSAAIYCKRVLDDGTDLGNMYDAAKILFRMYDKRGDVHKANYYAGVYMALSDSLDFGKRQEVAATVNNEFQYHLDQKKEQTLTREKEKYRNTLLIVLLGAAFLAVIGYTLNVRRRNKHLREVVALSSALQRVSDNDKQLRADIEKREQELLRSRESLEKSSDELASVKRELQRVNGELSDYSAALKEKEQQLTEKMEQNKTFIKLLHQSELEGTAEDVVEAIRQSWTGKKNMRTADWKQLYQAVDELYPLFKDRLLKELGNFTEQQMQVCYLMRVGLTKPQIQNMTNLSRVTIWRWVKKYDWVLTPDEAAADSQTH